MTSTSSTVPLSSDEVGIYSPSSFDNLLPKPRFRFRTPTPRDQKRFNHYCTLEGLQMFPPQNSRDEMKRVLEANWTSETFKTEIARLDDYWARMDQGIALSIDELTVLAELSARCREISPLLRLMEAENSRFSEEGPRIALRMYLCGWENLKTPFELEAGLLSEQRMEELLRELMEIEKKAFTEKVVGCIPGMAAMQLSTHAFFLMSLDKEAEKNSPAPSPSSETQSGSSTRKNRDGASRPGSKSGASRRARTRAKSSRSSS